MCLSPIRLPNRYNFSRSYNTLERGNVTIQPNGRKFIYVPCGKCKQCLQQKRDSLYVRVRNEYIFAGKRGIFHTLTYDPLKRPSAKYVIPPIVTPLYEEVKKRVYADKPYPLYTDIEDSFCLFDEGYSTNISCWDKRHLQDYLKNLNDKILYDIGKSKGLTRLSHGKLSPEWIAFLRSTPRPLKYLVTCERGKSNIYTADNGRTRFGQQCPHYHIILIPQLPEDVLPLAYLRNLCVKLWSHGRSYPLVIKNKEGYKRSPYQSMQYVCKYITKNEGYDYKHTYYSNGVRKTVFIKPHDLTFQNYKEELRKTPFVLLSHGMGIEWLNSLDKDYFINEVLKKGIPDIGSNGKARAINVPSYYLNKVRYEQCKKADCVVYEPNNDTRKLLSSLENVSKFCKYEEIWDVVDGIPTFICYEVNLPTPSLRVNLPSPFHDTITKQLLHLKADFYAQYLELLKSDFERVNEAYNNSKSIQTLCKKYVENLESLKTHPDKSIRELCEKLETPLSYFKNLIFTIESDTLYLHVVNDYMRGVNYNLDNLVDFISHVKQYFSKCKIEKAEIEYYARLRKSIEEKPELFNNQPIDIYTDAQAEYNTFVINSAH